MRSTLQVVGMSVGVPDLVEARGGGGGGGAVLRPGGCPLGEAEVPEQHHAAATPGYGHAERADAEAVAALQPLLLLRRQRPCSLLAQLLLLLLPLSCLGEVHGVLQA